MREDAGTRRRGEWEMRRRGEEKKRSARGFVVLGVALFCFAALACGPNPNVLRSGKETPAPVTGERPVSSFEKDLDSLRTANFEYIFALRRKDGGKLDADDKAFIKQNKPSEINRVIVSDEDKAVLAGSHFPFPPDALKLLQTRFIVEDFSSATEKNVNANVNR